MPQITAPTDAVIKVTNTAICGTDLHILKGDLPPVSRRVCWLTAWRRCGHRSGRGAATFIFRGDIVAPSGVIANVGARGVRADPHLDRVWSENIGIATRLVDTVMTLILLKIVQSGKIDPKVRITHRFTLDHIPTLTTHSGVPQARVR